MDNTVPPEVADIRELILRLIELTVLNRSKKLPPSTPFDRNRFLGILEVTDHNALAQHCDCYTGTAVALTRDTPSRFTVRSDAHKHAPKQ